MSLFADDMIFEPHPALPVVILRRNSEGLKKTDKRIQVGPGGSLCLDEETVTAYNSGQQSAAHVPQFAALLTNEFSDHWDWGLITRTTTAFNDWNQEFRLVVSKLISQQSRSLLTTGLYHLGLCKSIL